MDIFGMSFFHERLMREGTVTVQSSAGVAAYMYETLHNKNGYFFTKNERRLVPISLLSYNSEKDRLSSEANLLLELVEGDKHMRHDRWMDHLDGLILAHGGWDALQSVARTGNELHEYVEETCEATRTKLRECVGYRNGYQQCKLPKQIETHLECQNWDEVQDCAAGTRCLYGVCIAEDAEVDEDMYNNEMGCRYAILHDPHVIDLRAQGLAKLKQHLNDVGMNSKSKDLLLDMAEMRLTGQATKESTDAAFDGPSASIVTSYSLDQDSLHQLMQAANAETFVQAAQDFLLADQIDRDENPDSDELWEMRKANWNRFSDEFEKMRKDFKTLSGEYRKVADLEQATIPEVGLLGPRALEIRLPIDANMRPVYANAVAEAPSTSRVFLVTELIKKLEKSGDKLSFIGQLGITIAPRGEQLAAYCLLKLLPPEKVHLRVDLKFDDYAPELTGDHAYYLQAGFRNIDRRCPGEDVDKLDGGMFNLWKLIYTY
jgi:hypothetical protein